MINIKNLNKDINTPIVISIILLAVAAGGIFAWQHWIPRDNKLFLRLSSEERITNEQRMAEKVVQEYENALETRERDKVLPYTTGDLRKEVQGWSPIFGMSNPHPGGCKILSSKKISDNEFEVKAQHFEEYTGEGKISYNDNTYTVKKIGDKYLISSIKYGKNVEITKEKSSISKNETANWKIYRSEEYGFGFKYPDNYQTVEVPLKAPTGLNIFLEKGSIMIQKADIDLPEDCIFDSKALEQKNMLSFVGPKEMNGINFYYYKNYPEYLDGYCNMSVGCLYQDIYRTLHNNNCYQIVYGRYDHSFIEGNPYGSNYKVTGNVQEVPKIFYQIISTFRFIK